MPALRSTTWSRIDGFTQKRSLRIRRTSSRVVSIENTENGPADTGFPLSIPVWNPAGAPFRT
ncbi:Uncharacterised protein [Mycobacteroides abscessus subsp. abscessus]|nr:Uncharacterised protein [Mycobacteroides abscessus subsp. abscessus]